MPVKPEEGPKKDVKSVGQQEAERLLETLEQKEKDQRKQMMMTEGKGKSRVGKDW